MPRFLHRIVTWMFVATMAYLALAFYFFLIRSLTAWWLG